jgi:hypothetical protein
MSHMGSENQASMTVGPVEGDRTFGRFGNVIDAEKMPHKNDAALSSGIT